ncbi:hypothetical protein Mal64_34710 [Pseudobythopirellula maris]|uniref:Sel1 repeat protein n=1 Tax=Pseudobythopirellula maris TaxID=2527991 RepID=A0A5C5ZH28_9BACT|nr:hypothetical protein [Pseudobythopirellula maris]TWT86642.1 hypothetical protein Mal64_34710 [Pseudobythopirellula maris]
MGLFSGKWRGGLPSVAVLSSDTSIFYLVAEDGVHGMAVYEADITRDLTQAPPVANWHYKETVEAVRSCKRSLAKECLFKASELGHLDALYLKCRYFDYHADRVALERNLRVGANGGNIKSMVGLGSLLTHNDQLKEAETLFRKAYEKGSIYAINLLASLYACQHNNPTEARQLSMLAADEGDKQGLIGVAAMSMRLEDWDTALSYGKRVEVQDPDTGRKLLKDIQNTRRQLLHIRSH